ncbi:sensor histidine kinase [Eubacterium multiforme]|uniref:histidine kinase n=1 Tax=Eubacterium multiforme TaxID=83339 RepID=A0ABT9UP69_9FIRM|nr:HAMP domain-containing sensor histidine kinase [Eubacterium multiforme]MDQ0148437.1 signal transduction histidine kinase [Eubacterium multiforme]
MEFNRKMRDIIYINKKNYIIMTLIFFAIYIVLYCLTSIFFERNIDMFEFIIRIFVLISTFSILLLIYSTKNVFDVRIFKFLSIHFIVIILINLNSLLFEVSKLNLNYYDKVLYRYFGNVLFILSAGLVYKYLRDPKIKLLKNIFIIFIVISIMNLLKVQEYYLALDIFNLIIILLICLRNILIIKKYKIYWKHKINYIYVYTISIFMIVIINCISLIFKIVIINEMVNLIFFISFSSMVSCAIYVIINIPYKVLFKELYERNEKLNNINTNISIKNSELEVSHILIRKKEMIFKDFFKSIPVPIIILSDNTSRVIYCNKYFLSLIEEENIRNVINKKISKLIKFNEDDTFEVKYICDKKIYRGEIECNGHGKYLNIEVIDYNKENGEIILNITDITSKIKINTMKENIERKLLQEKIKRDFLSNISHDLKTPINVIYSALQLEHIFIENKDRQALLKYNGISKKNCLSLMKLTNNLIDSSKIESGYLYPNLKRINVVEFVEDTVNSLICYAKQKEIELLFDTNNEEIYLNLDENFMHRILLNIISNSIKYILEDGKIFVGVFENEEDINIVIKDNGVGMSKEFIDKIFIKYSMGKNNHAVEEKGSGIGLFVVKKLVELQYGSIDVNSNEGNGTKITISFKRENNLNEYKV